MDHRNEWTTLDHKDVVHRRHIATGGFGAVHTVCFHCVLDFLTFV
jgi:hypothetical protein